MIHLDTSFLISSLNPSGSQSRQFKQWLEKGEQVNLSTIAWFEFLCGPLPPAAHRQACVLFPNPEPFLPEDAVKAAELFNKIGRKRSHFRDCLIAAVAIRVEARLATSNPRHFHPFSRHNLKFATH